MPQLFELTDALAPHSQSASTTDNTSEAPIEPHFDPVIVNLIDALLNSFASTFDRGRLTESRLSPASIGLAAELYRQLGTGSRARYALLQLLAADDRSAAMAAFADCIAADPPADARQIGIAFLPLFQRTDYAAAASLSQAAR